MRAEGVEAIAEASVARRLTGAAPPDLAARVRAMLVATPAEGYAGCCAAIERMDIVADLPRIAAPALVIAGAEDPSTPPAHGELIASAIPGARLEVLDGAAHLGNVERPDLVNPLLAEFLAA